MAAFNKVILIGRLTRDPECRTFSNGGKVAKFGFAVTNRKKNSQTGQWEDEPMFIDCEAFNRGEFGTLANTIETYAGREARSASRGNSISIHGTTRRPGRSGEAQDRRGFDEFLDARQAGRAANGRWLGPVLPAGPGAMGGGGDGGPEEMRQGWRRR